MTQTRIFCHHARFPVVGWIIHRATNPGGRWGAVGKTGFNIYFFIRSVQRRAYNIVMDGPTSSGRQKGKAIGKNNSSAQLGSARLASFLLCSSTPRHESVTPMLVSSCCYYSDSIPLSGQRTTAEASPEFRPRRSAGGNEEDAA